MSIITNIEKFDEGCYAFIGRDIILRSDGTLLGYDDMLSLKESFTCGDSIYEQEYSICAIGIQETDKLPEKYVRRPLRLYNNDIPEDCAMKAFRAKGLVEWYYSHRFCHVCGHKLVPHDTLTALVCSECGKIHFPRIEPCIIVLVHRDDKVLLVRHVQRNQNIYACIAGFMETGETAEQTVVREIKEETGISVRNVKYFGSQSWPFPSQLMLGFTADYESGELNLQEDELSDAGWFTVDDCPATPQPGSIAYRLIHNIRD